MLPALALSGNTIGPSAELTKLTDAKWLQRMPRDILHDIDVFSYCWIEKHIGNSQTSTLFCCARSTNPDLLSQIWVGLLQLYFPPNKRRKLFLIYFRARNGQEPFCCVVHAHGLVEPTGEMAKFPSNNIPLAHVSIWRTDLLGSEAWYLEPYVSCRNVQRDILLSTISWASLPFWAHSDGGFTSEALCFHNYKYCMRIEGNRTYCTNSTVGSRILKISRWLIIFFWAQSRIMTGPIWNR